MIANLSGRILEITPNNITIDMGGVGLDVYVTSPFLEKCQAGEKIFLFTMMIVREDSLTLYGFESKEEKQPIGFIIADKSKEKS